MFTFFLKQITNSKFSFIGVNQHSIAFCPVNQMVYRSLKRVIINIFGTERTVVSPTYLA